MIEKRTLHRIDYAKAPQMRGGSKKIKNLKNGADLKETKPRSGTTVKLESLRSRGRDGSH